MHTGPARKGESWTFSVDKRLGSQNTDNSIASGERRHYFLIIFVVFRTESKQKTQAELAKMVVLLLARIQLALDTQTCQEAISKPVALSNFGQGGVNGYTRTGDSVRFMA